ncbi:MAG: phosphonate metabolism transcriptional regulator PhnF [Rivularia sp. ALOHA_DT_140]|nr:phosphonate metabolism transcriptional regulator PhnF [Rivularia sp. ALOHA_DT_140]
MNSDTSPLYVQIADEIRESINQGIYKKGQKLPSETKFSEQFAVNRHTIRQAIGLLKLEGLLRVDRGRGMFVASKTIRYPIGKRVRYNQALKAQGRQGSYELLRTVELPADVSVAKNLEIDQGEPVAMIEHLGFADTEPIIVATSYFPLKLFPNLLAPENIKLLQEIKSISKLMQKLYSCDHIRRSTSVSARIIQPQDAKLLQVAHNQPILLVESVNLNQTGDVIEYGVTRFAGDKVILDFENLS